MDLSTAFKVDEFVKSPTIYEGPQYDVYLLLLLHQYMVVAI